MLIGTIGAGIGQIADKTEILTQPSTEDTAVSGIISLVVGVISMLISRFLNKLARKKEGRTK